MVMLEVQMGYPKLMMLGVQMGFPKNLRFRRFKIMMMVVTLAHVSISIKI